MEKVNFIHVENERDIIISLSCEENSTFGVDGFTIQRNPGFDLFFAPEERGACVEWESEDDIRVLLDEVNLTRNCLRIKTKGKIREYNFDIEKIEDDEYEDLKKHFHLINFDNSIKINIRDKGKK